MNPPVAVWPSARSERAAC